MNFKKKIIKEVENFKRTLLLKGSPAFKIGVWFSGLTIGLAWILFSEYNYPKTNNLFIKKREADIFTSEEIDNWNKPYFSKNKQNLLVEDPKLTIDEKREIILKQINKMK